LMGFGNTTRKLFPDPKKTAKAKGILKKKLEGVGS